ncbi:hypothetical protein CASFOL_011151 [Castilleja foliolosa]|uniref:Uncharacterized protein n=1 Tax=Castilleja foliolosa TaxID=1961234 RepID=A0ABD3DYS4_9LAMI
MKKVAAAPLPVDIIAEKTLSTEMGNGISSHSVRRSTQTAADQTG